MAKNNCKVWSEVQVANILLFLLHIWYIWYKQMGKGYFAESIEYNLNKILIIY